MFIHQLLTLCFLSCIFFLHPISAFSGNFLTSHFHFDFLVDSDSPHVSTSTGKLALGFGRPYVIANVVIFVITLLNIIVYKLRELQEENSGQKSIASSSSLASEQQLCRRFLLHEIVSATNNFDNSLVIGKGGFGKVYKGIIDNGSCTVAIKRLNSLSKQGAPEFWTEINMLSKFRHSHLVTLIGYCDDNNEMILVYEYMVRGSLAEHLHKNSKNNNHNNVSDRLNLSWVQRLKICIGAARGLDYLHTGTAVLQRVIHRDVKSSNILLDDNWAAKISDFGLSRIGPADQEYTHVSTKHIKGTFGYMDPDYFLTRRITRKSDVYAFGVVLLEVLCERSALDRSLDEDQWSLAGWGHQCIKEGAAHKLIGPNLEWEILPNSLMEFVQIADQCLHSHPKRRPTMSEVVAKLELALALQLRTNLVNEEDSFDMFCPFNNQEDPESYPTLVHSNPEISSNAQNNNSGHNITLQNEDGGAVPEVHNSGKIVTPNLKIFTFDELRRATNYFRLDEGRFGTIFKGWLDEKTYSPSKVGFGKAVIVERLDQEDMQNGWTVVEILGKCRHPNIVNLLGYYCEEDKEFFLVYEYLQNGTLFHQLYSKAAKPLPWDTRLKVAVGAARGLSFLHATENQVVLRNFMTNSILLDGDFNAKLSSFRLAKRRPENGDLDMKADIYRFGVMLLKILTGAKMLEESRQGKINIVDWSKPLLAHKKTLRREVVDPRLENDYPPKGAFKLASLILKCLQNDPKLRPSMKQVLQSLEQIDSIKIKPKVEEAQTRSPMVPKEVTAYKLSWWIRDLVRSSS